LLLDENEAFLALNNVSSFVHLLLKQIEEKIAYENELKKIPSIETQKETSEISAKEQSLIDIVLKSLGLFSKEIENEYELKEIEIIGKLNAFLEKLHTELVIYREPNYKIGNIQIRPDLVIEYEHDKVVLEVKRNPQKGKLKADIDQITSYLSLTGLKNGVLYFWNIKMQENTVRVDYHHIVVNELSYNVYVVF
jgi:hypothetical protein